MTYEDVCDRATLYLTNDGLQDIVVIAGAGGAPRQVIGRQENSEEAAQGNPTQCGDYSEISLTSVPAYPSSINVVTGP